MAKSNFLIGKPSVEAVNFLLKENKIEKFILKKYIPKTHYAFDKTFEYDGKADFFKAVSSLAEKDYVVGFYSRVLIGNKYFHFPMIDFSNSIVKDLNLNGIKEVLLKLGEKDGFIVNSGRSFHYYGNRLMTNQEWKNFLESCQNHPEIGLKYISRQLGDGGCVLRLTTSAKKPVEPLVISAL